jgi:hypothetical protein
VKGGRLVLDEPSTLPEGTEVDLIPADDIDDLDPTERARLHGFLADSIRKHVPGTGVPADEVLTADAEEPFDLDEAQLTELEERMADADRGEVDPAAAVLERLRRGR